MSNKPWHDPHLQENHPAFSLTNTRRDSTGCGRSQQGNRIIQLLSNNMFLYNIEAPVRHRSLEAEGRCVSVHEQSQREIGNDTSGSEHKVLIDKLWIRTDQPEYVWIDLGNVYNSMLKPWQSGRAQGQQDTKRFRKELNVLVKNHISKSITQVNIKCCPIARHHCWLSAKTLTPHVRSRVRLPSVMCSDDIKL